MLVLSLFTSSQLFFFFQNLFAIAAICGKKFRPEDFFDCSSLPCQPSDINAHPFWHLSSGIAQWAQKRRERRRRRRIYQLHFLKKGEKISAGVCNFVGE